MPVACILSAEMFFAMRIAAAAKTLGVPLVILRSAAEVPTKLPADCRLAMIDLGSLNRGNRAGTDLVTLVAGIQAVAPNAKVIAFGPHVDHQLLEQATAAGCATMSNGEFNNGYVNLLQKLLSDS